MIDIRYAQLFIDRVQGTHRRGIRIVPSDSTLDLHTWIVLFCSELTCVPIVHMFTRCTIERTLLEGCEQWEYMFIALALHPFSSGFYVLLGVQSFMENQDWPLHLPGGKKMELLLLSV